MTKNKTFQCAVFLCGLSVVFGAFGAHLLENLLDYHGKIDVFKTAISFQFNHSLALLFVGFLMTNKKNNHLFWTSLFFIFGILFFFWFVVLALSYKPFIYRIINSFRRFLPYYGLDSIIYIF